MKQKIIIANWKMNLSLAESLKLAKKFKEKFKNFSKGEVVVCPPFIVLDEISKMLAKTNIKVGAQNVFWEESGAYTGEISPSMLVEAGTKYVIIGHSERRKYLLENYSMIHKEIKAVLDVGSLTPIICIGENWEERKTDRRDFVLDDQMQLSLGGIDFTSKQQIIIAYEPIWAIGSGNAIEPAEAEYAHKIIKLTLNKMFGLKAVNNNFRVIYGGSINNKNVGQFSNLEGIDGLLVGGASLDVNMFYKIAKAILK
ncbi:MAG: triose-phosphate isomerase [Patescibacteria group bacterium]